MNNKDLITTISSLDYELDKGGIGELIFGSGVTTLRLVGKASLDIEALRLQILNEKSSGMTLSPTVGDIYQDFYQKVSFKNQELLNAFTLKIADIIKTKLYEANNVQSNVPIVFDSVIIQHYPHSTSDHLYAIPPHYDHKGFVELVIILLLEGESLFYTAKDKEGKEERVIDANPMDIIVMRGYQFQGKDERPVHYVKKITSLSGRTSLSFRIYSKNEEHLASIRKAFSVT